MKCIKCGYDSGTNKEKFGDFLCDICHHLSPNKEELFKEYILDKVDGSILESFRKYFKSGDKQKQGMVRKAIKGIPMSRAPFGYKMVDGRLIPADNFGEVEEIFEEFLEDGKSLRKIADKHKISVNGLKKVLRNFVYIGKIKFNNQVFEGDHKPIISSTLFNHVQDKIDRLGLK